MFRRLGERRWISYGLRWLERLLIEKRKNPFGPYFLRVLVGQLLLPYKFVSYDEINCVIYMNKDSVIFEAPNFSEFLTQNLST